MGRARNTKTRDRIRKTAIALFSEKGYVDTSISDIAKACKIERSIVQYYFPYKDMFIIEFLDKCLTLIAELTQKLDEERFDMFGRLYFMGHVLFSLLIDNKKMQKLTRDIVVSRQLTEVTMPLYCQWTKQFSGVSFKEDATIIAMGGAYELIHHYMKNNLDISSHYVTEQCYITFSAYHGQARDEALRKLKKYHLSDGEVREVIAMLEKELFQ